VALPRGEALPRSASVQSDPGVYTVVKGPMTVRVGDVDTAVSDISNVDARTAYKALRHTGQMTRQCDTVPAVSLLGPVWT
jgi:hypothetical protein